MGVRKVIYDDIWNLKYLFHQNMYNKHNWSMLTDPHTSLGWHSPYGWNSNMLKDCNNSPWKEYFKLKHTLNLLPSVHHK